MESLVRRLIERAGAEDDEEWMLHCLSLPQPPTQLYSQASSAAATAVSATFASASAPSFEVTPSLHTEVSPPWTEVMAMGVLGGGSRAGGREEAAP